MGIPDNALVEEEPFNYYVTNTSLRFLFTTRVSSRVY